ncbi:methyltransferase domain-containing protein [Methanoregula boonei]|nr:methyltransferase domain-containing protein [Methanoregula boonei]
MDLNKNPILFVNHRPQKCGVYEFGLAIGNTLTKSRKYNFIYREIDNWLEFKEIFDQLKPSIVLYNYYPSTMGWISEWNGMSINSHKVNAIQIGIIHEVTQEISDRTTDLLFDYYIAADPTLLLKNPIVYKTGRLIPRFEGKLQSNKIINIGSFGFATQGKGFIKIIEKVQEEFDEAMINLNISFAKYADENGDNAKKIAKEAQKFVTKKGIFLNISHEHLSTDDLLKFLSKNDLNMFLYEYQENRGISSVTDWAVSVKKPLVITKSKMFRHLFECYPSICIEDNSIKTILKNGIKPIEWLYEEWSPDNLLWDYERIVTDILNKSKTRPTPSRLQKKIMYVLNKFHLKRIRPPHSISPWLKIDDSNLFDGFVDKSYIPLNDNDLSYNIILDDPLREKYKRTLDFIKAVSPDLYAKKILKANIQQGFVFDTAYRIASQKDSMKILAIGAFEDTAALALKKLGFSIEFIDPIINYDLETYITKPSVKSQNFDVIISTSVIEHVKDDERFIKDIAYLLKVGGWGILTCDFNNSYKIGDSLPKVDCRLYTQKDFLERLLPSIPNCKLVDTPNWIYQNPDFIYDNCHYSFASLVFKKVEP